MREFKKLKYRRQFLFSAKKCDKLKDWNVEFTGKNYLYIHPDCELSKVITENHNFYLIGFAINPHLPDKSSLQILEDISGFSSTDDIFKFLYPLTGRFVLIIESENRILVFNDACGLRQVHYTKFENKLFVASQPLLLQEVVPIKKSENFHIYFKSKYVKTDIEHNLPSGISLYENVFHLVPNHYLSTEDYKQKRFWPLKELSPTSFDEAVEKAAKIVKNSIYAANKRYKLALGLTAGRDSRVVLSGSKDLIDNIFVYTLKYRNLTKQSNDIKIPKRLSARMGFEHNLINCNKEISKEFAEIYKGNSDIAHWDDWGIIANGMYGDYPDDRIAVRGHCIEAGRCDYYKLGIHRKIKNPESFALYYKGYNINFIKETIVEWYKEVSNFYELGYNLLDIYFWEHDMGSWQAQSLLEWDIIHETFAPYNNRELLDITLSVPARYRCKPGYKFFSKLSETMWPGVMNDPINPKSFFEKTKNLLKDIFIFFGIKISLKRLY